MIENQIRSSLGGLDATTYGVVHHKRAQAGAEPALAKAVKYGEGPSYSSHVIAPSVLIAAQETRATEAVRRESGANPSSTNPNELTEEEQRIVQELKKVDREVRAHERAHRAAGGTLTGAAQFTYVRGPDGKQYAVSGEVSIDVGREGSAAATAAKMEAVIRAALAPAKPSAQDVAVAAQARQVLNEVSQEAREERLNVNEEGQGSGSAVTSGVRGDVEQALDAYRQNTIANRLDELVFAESDQSISLIA